MPLAAIILLMVCSGVYAFPQPVPAPRHDEGVAKTVRHIERVFRTLENSTSAPLTANTTHVIGATLTLAITLEAFNETFKVAFVKRVADVVGVETSRVVITSVRSGSVVVALFFVSDNTEGSLARLLRATASDPSSSLSVDFKVVGSSLTTIAVPSPTTAVLSGLVGFKFKSALIAVCFLAFVVVGGCGVLTVVRAMRKAEGGGREREKKANTNDGEEGDEEEEEKA